MLDPQVVRRTGRRRTSCGRSATQLGRDPLPRHARRLPARSTPAATRSSRRSTGRCRRSPRSGSTSAARAPNAKNPRAVLRQPQDPDAASGTGSWACAATTSTTPRPAVIDYRTGEVLAYVGQRELHVQGQQEVPAPVRRPRRRLAPARIGDQADQLPHRHRRQDADRLDDVHGRHHELRRRLHPDPGRQARARAGPRSARRSSSRSTSRPSRPTIMSGLDHLFERTKDFGLTLSRTTALPGRCRWASGRSRSTRSTCSARTARSPTAAC